MPLQGPPTEPGQKTIRSWAKTKRNIIWWEKKLILQIECCVWIKRRTYNSRRHVSSMYSSMENKSVTTTKNCTEFALLFLHFQLLLLLGHLHPG